jgi:hypothetical protein
MRQGAGEVLSAAVVAAKLPAVYEDFDYSPGLVKLGRIDSGIEALTGRSGEVTVTVSRSTP